MSVAKKILLEELENEEAEIAAEHVIFWALENHFTRGHGTPSELIAYKIVHRILSAEREEKKYH